MLYLLGKNVEAEQAFGETLRNIRLSKGWSQEKLAFEAGVDRNYISLMELGRNSPSIKMIFKLCRALEVTVTECMAAVEALDVEVDSNGKRE